MKTAWHILQPRPEAVESLVHNLGCSEILATLLINRGLNDPQEAAQHLSASIEALGPPPDSPDVNQALRRLHSALQHREAIIVFGDYDVDGVTGTALLTSFLRDCGGRVLSRLPHRTRDGYGLQLQQVADIVHQRQAAVIITVDCGISSQAAIAVAQQAGIDVIVTDHHTLETPLPPALAVINPKRPGCPPAWADLAGVGVAFGLAISLRAHLRRHGFWNGRPEPNLRQLGDLVALGTVADIVPLLGANRVLTRMGLEVINSSPRPGLRALIGLSGCGQRLVEAEDIAFRLAPRLNAAGRMDHADIALDLLLANDPRSAEPVARRLEELNLCRQATDREVHSQAEALIAAHLAWMDQPVLVLAREGWHEGVLGIVAARLAKHYHRPTLLLSINDGVAKGSARSIPGIDLHSALSRCSDLLSAFGGHAMAAGVRLSSARLDELRGRLSHAVHQISPATGVAPQLRIDCALPFHCIDERLLAEIDQLKPCGPGHPEPLFLASDVRVLHARRVGSNHCRLRLDQPGNPRRQWSAIRFRVDSREAIPPHLRRIAFRLRRHPSGGTWPPEMIIDAWET